MFPFENPKYYYFFSSSSWLTFLFLSYTSLPPSIIFFHPHPHKYQHTYCFTKRNTSLSAFLTLHHLHRFTAFFPTPFSPFSLLLLPVVFQIHFLVVDLNNHLDQHFFHKQKGIWSSFLLFTFQLGKWPPFKFQLQQLILFLDFLLLFKHLVRLEPWFLPWRGHQFLLSFQDKRFAPWLPNINNVFGGTLLSCAHHDLSISRLQSRYLVAYCYIH